MLQSPSSPKPASAIDPSSHQALLMDPLMRAPSSRHIDALEERLKSPDLASRPSALNPYARRSARRVTQAYDLLYTSLGARDEDTLLYCHSLAQATTHLLWGMYIDYGRPWGKSHMITLSSSDGSIIMNMERLKTLGVMHDLVSMRHDGTYDLDHLRSLICPRTLIVSLQLVHPLSGVIQPLDELRALCGERGIFLHIDLSQAYSQFPCPLDELGADMITLDGRALGTLYGGALLWMRKGLKVGDLIPGGAPFLTHTDISPVLIEDLALAMEESLIQRDSLSMEAAMLKNLFESRIKAVEVGHILFEKSPRVATISMCAFTGICAELAAYYLDQAGLGCSIGGGSQQQTHYLLTSCHYPAALVQSALTFYIDPRLKRAGVEELANTLLKTIQKLRQGAPKFEVTL